MNFKKWVKSIQTAGYNGAQTVFWGVANLKNILTSNDIGNCFQTDIGSEKYLGYYQIMMVIKTFESN